MARLTLDLGGDSKAALEGAVGHSKSHKFWGPERVAYAAALAAFLTTFRLKKSRAGQPTERTQRGERARTQRNSPEPMPNPGSARLLFVAHGDSVEVPD